MYFWFAFLHSDGFMGDIAVTNINYENEWQTQKLNKTFQQELERMKQEVYHEGLQVEEEGLTDIIRKKTKLPHIETPDLNEASKNDASLLVSIAATTAIIIIEHFDQYNVRRRSADFVHNNNKFEKCLDYNSSG